MYAFAMACCDLDLRLPEADRKLENIPCQFYTKIVQTIHEI